MTREDVIKELEWLDQWLNNHDFMTCATRDAIRIAIAALRGPVPDPETGLVPCGCGGTPEYIHSVPLINGGTFGVRCFRCDAMIGLVADESSLVGDYVKKNYAKSAWNTMRGYKEGKE
jgi:hypothetical protein